MSKKKQTMLQIAKPILKVHQEEAESLTLEDIDDLTAYLNVLFKYELGLITEEEEEVMRDEIESRMILRNCC